MGVKRFGSDCKLARIFHRISSREEGVVCGIVVFRFRLGGYTQHHQVFEISVATVCLSRNDCPKKPTACSIHIVFGRESSESRDTRIIDQHFSKKGSLVFTDEFSGTAIVEELIPFSKRFG